MNSPRIRRHVYRRRTSGSSADQRLAWEIAVANQSTDVGKN
ncbi:MAG: hypothetical protein U1D30_05485 [Planctomycetota bacterium]